MLLNTRKAKPYALYAIRSLKPRKANALAPTARQRLEVKTTQRVVRERSYFNIITAVKGFQVVRMFLMIVEFRKGMKANPAFIEIGQYWIDKYGYATVAGLQRTLGHYIDSFAFGSPLEIRSDNDAFQHIADQCVSENKGYGHR